MERDSNDFPILKERIYKAMAKTRMKPDGASLLSEMRRVDKRGLKTPRFTDSDFLYVVWCLIEDGKIKIVGLKDATWEGHYGSLIVDLILART